MRKKTLGDGATGMYETWSGPGITSDDLQEFLHALSLSENNTPLIAVSADEAGKPRVVAASRAVFSLFGVADPESLSARVLSGTDPGGKRLAVLFQMLPLEGPPRLERLRFLLGDTSEIVTLLCRRLAVRGRIVLVAAVPGLKPGLVTAVASKIDLTRPASDGPAGDALYGEGLESTGLSSEQPGGTCAGETAVAIVRSRFQAKWPGVKTLRFLWHTDETANCTMIGPPLASVVGDGATGLVGQNLSDVARRLDPASAFAQRLQSRETWSGIALNWPVDETMATVKVVTGAIPAFRPGPGPSGPIFDGFRGFGVIHLDEITEVPAGPSRPAVLPAAPDQTQVDARQVDQAGDSVPAPGLESRPSEGLAGANLVNVLPFPISSRGLSPEDHSTFQKIGDALRKDEPSLLAPSLPVPSLPVPSLLTPSLPVPAEPAASGAPVALPRDRAQEPRAILESLSEAVAGLAAIAPHAHPPLPVDGALEGVKKPPFGPDTPATIAVEPHLPEAASSDVSPLIPALPGQEPRTNGHSLLDKLNLGLLVSRNNIPIFANRFLLDMLGFEDEDELHEAGGMTHLFGGLPGNASGSETVGVRDRDGTIRAANARMQAVEWDGLPATLLTLQPANTALKTAPDVDARRQQESELRELRAILETATDGVAVLDAAGNVLSLNRSGEALFGCDRADMIGQPFLALFAPHNQSLALDYFEGLKSNATKSLLNDGREFLIKAHRGGTIPVFMTLGRLGSPGPGISGAPPGEDVRYCALFRDLTHWKKVEQELDHARQDAERTSALKSDFLAKVSHEVRTPLNAIIGFAEVIMEERFGPVGNQRYKDYLRDIHASGTHVMSLINDLLDLSKIEAGKMELTATPVDANKIITECTAIMQPQASQERVIMRLSLAPALPRIKADERSLRQIVLNLLSNAVKFNEAGGQVIVATTLTDGGHVVLRIRDTGPGMSEKDIETALEPFRQLSTSRKAPAGTGLGLPLTKALVEANHASFTIRSKVNQGTMAEVAFPPALVLAN